MSERKVRAYSSYSRDALIPPAAGEGVAWLGRQPWAEASFAYRALRFTLRVVLGAFGMRIRQDHPTPGVGHGIQDGIDR